MVPRQYIDTNNQIEQGGSHVILVGFLFDHRIGGGTTWLFKHRRGSGRDSKDPVWDIPGLVSHLAIPWAASCVSSVHVRVAQSATRTTLSQKCARLIFLLMNIQQFHSERTFLRKGNKH